MMMAFKYQLLRCKSGHELLMVTLTHLDGLRLMVNTSHAHVEMVNRAIQKCVERYDQLSSAQLMLLRHTVLQFVQDNLKKVHLLQLNPFILHLFTRYPFSFHKIFSYNQVGLPFQLEVLSLMAQSSQAR